MLLRSARFCWWLELRQPIGCYRRLILLSPRRALGFSDEPVLRNNGEREWTSSNRPLIWPAVLSRSHRVPTTAPSLITTIESMAALLQESRIKNVPLKAAHLESMRIVSHNKDDLRSRSFDMLRTQVLQSMDNAGWQVLAVTSPTAGCGKTVTACNLALSIARLPERSVLLVDLDMRKPKVADYLGIKRDFGLLSVLQGRQNLSDTIVQVGIEREQFLVLPGEHTQCLI